MLLIILMINVWAICCRMSEAHFVIYNAVRLSTNQTLTHTSISLISVSILWIKLNKHMHNETKRNGKENTEKKKTNQENTHARFNFASKRIKCLCRPVYSHPQHVFSTLIESGQQYFLVHKIQTTVAWFYFIYIVVFLAHPIPKVGSLIFCDQYHLLSYYTHIVVYGKMKRTKKAEPTIMLEIANCKWLQNE